MKLSSKLFAIAFASILSTGAVMADDITQDLLYGSQATETDFSRMPATAAGNASHETPMDESIGVSAIPDYLEGLNSR